MEDQNLGAQPYLFEPRMAQHQPVIDSDQNDNEENEALDVNLNNERIGNTNWCRCNNCKEMPTVIESLCCQEVRQIREKAVGHSCIQTYRRFIINCTDIDVLEIHYRMYAQHTNDRNDFNIHEKYRYVAYGNYIYVVHGRVGRYRRTPIPSCVVSKIREMFPAESEEYTGFKYPRFLDV